MKAKQSPEKRCAAPMWSSNEEEDVPLGHRLGIGGREREPLGGWRKRHQPQVIPAVEGNQHEEEEGEEAG